LISLTAGCAKNTKWKGPYQNTDIKSFFSKNISEKDIETIRKATEQMQEDFKNNMQGVFLYYQYVSQEALDNTPIPQLQLMHDTIVAYEGKYCGLTLFNRLRPSVIRIRVVGPEKCKPDRTPVCVAGHELFWHVGHWIQDMEANTEHKLPTLNRIKCNA